MKRSGALSRSYIKRGVNAGDSNVVQKDLSSGSVRDGLQGSGGDNQ